MLSQLLTLYITPVTYTYLESLRQWLARRSWTRHANQSGGISVIGSPEG